MSQPTVTMFDKDDLPPAYGGCTCDCHRWPNIFHCMPCCYPGKENLLTGKHNDLSHQPLGNESWFKKGAASPGLSIPEEVEREDQEHRLKDQQARIQRKLAQKRKEKK
jgi:hypothetical protein